MKSIFHLRILCYFLPVLFWACNPARHLTDNQFLLSKNIIKSNKPEYTEELRSVIRQKPNRKILGVIRFHLGVYNFFYRAEDTTTWFKRAKRSIRNTVGEPPVILDTMQVNRTSSQMELFLVNKGYFNAQVKDSIVYKKKKAKVYYLVNSNEPYSINKIDYASADSAIYNFLIEDQKNSLLHEKDGMDINMLQKERERITSELRNNGYYYFSREYIYYKLDSSLGNHKINVLLGVRRINENNPGYKPVNHQKYRIKNVYIQPDFNPKELEVRLTTDTLNFNNYEFISHNKKLEFKPSVITQSLYIKKGQYFKAVNLDNSYKGLSELGVFKYINITFTPDTSDSLNPQLICLIHLTPSPKESFTISAEGTHNSPNLGVAGNIIFRNKNTFKGAELLEFKVRGALEAQKVSGTTGDLTTLNLFNTAQVGPEVNLYIPKFLLPFHLAIPATYSPKTNIATSFNYEKRQLYNRSITNATINYSWKEGQYKRHVITPIEINNVNVVKQPDFDKKLKISDPLISYSYASHLTTLSRYTFIYSNQNINTIKSFIFFRWNIEVSGNILRAANLLLKSPRDTNGSYRIFEVPYSQYIRPEADFRHYYPINSRSSFVWRVYGGAGFAYGNAKSLPLEKLFFAGGANDIRGWQARTLGPGSTQPGTNSLDRFGDLKLEANLEYRFPLFKILEGAAFIDAGNIWNLKLKEKGEQKSVFSSETFIDQIAIAGGLGARLNFSFFILRIDGGIKLKDPEQMKWVYGKTRIKDIVWSLGIGYPF